MQREGLVVLGVDLVQAAIEFLRRDAGFGMLTDLPREDHVVDGDRRPVAPPGIAADLIGDGHARFSIRRRIRHRQTVLDGRQLGAQHANQFPVGVDNRDRPPGHAQHIGFRQHGVDVGMKRRRILGDADHQFASVVLGQPWKSDRQENGEDKKQLRALPYGMDHALGVSVLRRRRLGESITA